MNSSEQTLKRAMSATVRAASDWNDPTDALSIIDVADYIDEGKIDLGAIRDAVDKVGRSKPHLLSAPRRSKPSADGGGREGPAKSGNVEKILERIKQSTGIS
jgi:hypothetical protein